MLDRATPFIHENWPLISACLFLSINVLNGVTKHWSDQKGVVKAATFITELLAIIASHGSQKHFKMIGRIKK